MTAPNRLVRAALFDSFWVWLHNWGLKLIVLVAGCAAIAAVGVHITRTEQHDNHLALMVDIHQEIILLNDLVQDQSQSSKSEQAQWAQTLDRLRDQLRDDLELADPSHDWKSAYEDADAQLGDLIDRLDHGEMALAEQSGALDASLRDLTRRLADETDQTEGFYADLERIAWTVFGVSLALSLIIAAGYVVTNRQYQRKAIVHRRKNVEIMRWVGESVSMGHWFVDLESGRLDLSPIAHSLFGTSESSNIDLRDDATMKLGPTDRRQWIDALNLATHTGTFPPIRLQITDIGGTVRTLDIRGVVERNLMGAPVAVQGLIQDVTRLLTAEKSLAASKQRFQEFADTSSEWFWERDAEGRFVYLSEHFESLTGLTIEQFLGSGIDTFGSSDEDERQTVVDAFRSQKSWRDVVFAIAGNDGVPIWVRTSGKPIYHSDGTFKGYVGTASNTTELVNARRAAEKAELRLRDAIETIPNGFALFDSQDRLVLFNENYVNAYPTSAGAIEVGRTFEEILRYGLERGQYAVDPNDPAAVESWLKERLKQHQSPDGPIEQPTNDGRWLLIHESRTSTGETVGFRVDITAIKEKEEALAKQLAFQQTLLDTIPIPVFYKGRDFRYLGCNHAFLDFYRLREEQVIGHTISDISGAVVSQAFNDQDLRLIDNPASHETREMQVDINGLQQDILICKAAFNDADGEPAGIVGALMDISESKQHVRDMETAQAALREQAERLQILARDLEDARVAAESASTAKSQFLATMSHELRTPMTGLLGMIDLLEGEALNQSQQGYVGILRQCADALMAMLTDVLDLSKIEAGRMTLETIPMHPTSLIREVGELFRQKAEAKGLDLFIDIDGLDGLSVCGDPTRFRQILFNLVSNAVKFTAEGTIHIAAVGERDGSNLKLNVSVRDTGIGISEDQLAGLFEIFRQADSTTTRQYGGTGLGLAICKRLAEAMGGAMTVRSTPSRGSTFGFTVSLPIATAPVAGSATTSHGTLTLGGLNILLAEDNEINRTLITTMLSRAGGTVHSAGNGQEALALLDGRDIDVVLLDVGMPVMDGPTAAARIRRRDDAYRSVPVIALTADAIAENHARYLEAGFDDIMTKPINWRRLTRLLSTFTRNETATARIAGSDPQQMELSLLDEDVLATLAATVGKHQLNKLLSLLETEADRLISQIEESCRGGIYEAARRDAHALKGLAGNFGAVFLAMQARRLEEGTDDTLADISVVQDLRSAYERTANGLQARAQTAAA